ncbi:Listeria/Bacterioides repeat-containing protein [Acetitomaculum ruminis DSM 5522]|uniref:Listeria/Bacterioides repeat-containing protein n=1 Tax=Acetitomaculum ruminis DSM 5522 TaxID=1120918 RepID=A0A1I0XBU0_9FIRM|nr:InlB B-repeat-containing protein [Acetitomaculum ruminis]SFA97886.1 Listeria/Bacterioides repeat-containing protein [Acetitomaculum ruminis DSM 5522]
MNFLKKTIAWILIFATVFTTASFKELTLVYAEKADKTTVVSFSVKALEHDVKDEETNCILKILVDFNKEITIKDHDKALSEISVKISGNDAKITRTMDVAVNESDEKQLIITLTTNSWSALYGGLMEVSADSLTSIVSKSNPEETVEFLPFSTYAPTGIKLSNEITLSSADTTASTKVTVTSPASMRGMFHYVLLFEGKPVLTPDSTNWYAGALTGHAHNFNTMTQENFASTMAMAINSINGYSAAVDSEDAKSFIVTRDEKGATTKGIEVVMLDDEGSQNLCLNAILKEKYDTLTKIKSEYLAVKNAEKIKLDDSALLTKADELMDNLKVSFNEETLNAPLISFENVSEFNFEAAKCLSDLKAKVFTPADKLTAKDYVPEEEKVTIVFNDLNYASTINTIALDDVVLSSKDYNLKNGILNLSEKLFTKGERATYNLSFTSSKYYKDYIVKIKIDKNPSCSLNVTDKTLKKGENFQLKLVSTIEDSIVDAVSSNEKIVTVDKNGGIKAIAPGSATITVTTLRGNELKCNIIVPYTITYRLNGGKNNKSNPDSYTKAFTLKNPVRSKYRFAGWYTDSKFIHKISKISAKNKKSYTLYAKWVKVTVKTPTRVKASKITKKTAEIKFDAIKSVEGYEVFYSTDKNFKNALKVIFWANNNDKQIKLKLKALKSKKKYYVKVRAYKLDSANKKVFGNYSKKLQFIAR